MLFCFILFLAMSATAVQSVQEVDLSRDCDQEFHLVKGQTEALTIKSHVYLGRRRYPASLDCKAIFKMDACKKATLNCPSFNVIGNQNDCADYLMVDDVRYCGPLRPSNLTFQTSSNLNLSFHTGVFFQGLGFNCQLTCEEFKDSPATGAISADCTPCGTSTLNSTSTLSRDGKIVGGQEVAKGEIGWQVALVQNATENPIQVFCGGTLLNAKFVMTAAHCTAAVAGNLS
jgi:hypothetical protein